MIPLVLAAVLAADPAPEPPVGGAAVLISRRFSVTPEQAQELAARVEVVLRQAGVPVRDAADTSTRRLACLDLPDPATCNGDDACVARLGEKLELSYVVAVQAAQLAQELALHVDVVQVESGKPIAERDVLVPKGGDVGAEVSRQLLPMAAEVAPKVPAPRARAKPEVAPRPAPEPTVVTKVVREQPPAMKRYALVPLAGGAAVALVGGLMLAQSSSIASDVAATPGRPLVEAYSLTQQAKSLQTTGAVLVGVGAAAAAAGVVMYVVAPESSTSVSALVAPSGAGVSVSTRW